MTKSGDSADDLKADPVFGSANAGLNAPESRKRAIAIKLTVIARQLRQKFDQAVGLHDLTRGKWGVIVAVARNPGTTQRMVASVLEITEVTAGQLIDRLCADGYLERRRHPKDRRAHCVYLTPKAQPLLGRLNEVAKVHEDETFAGLTEAELALLDGMLDKLAGNLALSRCRPDEKKAI